jgi:transcriptional regulator with XRE-family HTH domain
LPRRLQEVREARGKSRYALAREAGVSRDMIGCIESQRTVPTVHLLAKLAFALGMTLEALFGRVEDARGHGAGAVASDISD